VFVLLAVLILLVLAALVLVLVLIGETLRILATENERAPGANASNRKRHEHSAPKEELLHGVDLELSSIIPKESMSR
jgi:hypothetical protein